MPHVFLYSFYIIPRLERNNGVTMPIQYNNAKPKNPVIMRGAGHSVIFLHSNSNQIGAVF